MKNKDVADYILQRDKEEKERIMQFYEQNDEKQRQATEKAAELELAKKEIKVQNQKRYRAENPMVEENNNAARRLKTKEQKIDRIHKQMMAEKELKQQHRRDWNARYNIKSKIENVEERRVFILKMTKTLNRIKDADDALEMWSTKYDSKFFPGDSDSFKDVFDFGGIGALYGSLKYFSKHPWFTFKGIKVMNKLFRCLWDHYDTLDICSHCLRLGFYSLPWSMHATALQNL